MSAWKTAWKTLAGPLRGGGRWDHADVGVEDGVEDLSRPPCAAERSSSRRCRRGRRRGRRPPTPTPTGRLRRLHADVGVEDGVEDRRDPAGLPRAARAHADVGVEDGVRRLSLDPSTYPERCSGPHADVGVEDGVEDGRGRGEPPGADQSRRCRRGRRRGRRPGVATMPGPACMITPMSAWKTAWRDAVGGQPARTRLAWGHADVGVEDGVEDVEIVTSRGRPQVRVHTPMSAWKTASATTPTASGRSPDACNGGHADVGVEDGVEDDDVARRRRSLQWPCSRRCRRGRRRGRLRERRKVGVLQWPATPMSAWKTPRKTRGVAYGLSCGPWGHADVGVEDCVEDRDEAAAIAGPFNGATPMSAWKTAWRSPWSDRHRHAASMGPRRCRRGRLDRGHLGWHRRCESPMGPRRCRRGRRRGRRPASGTLAI